MTDPTSNTMHETRSDMIAPLEELADRLDDLEERLSAMEPGGNRRRETDQTDVESENGVVSTISTFIDMGLTRRESLHAAWLVTLGMSIGTAAIYGVTETARAQGAQGAIGTEENPLQDVHVENLHSQNDVISADELSINSHEVFVQDTEPSSPSVSDVWIDNSEAT